MSLDAAIGRIDQVLSLQASLSPPAASFGSPPASATFTQMLSAQTSTASLGSGSPAAAAPYAADIMRLDLKINLLLDMVGQLLAANRPRPPAVPVRFNALGGMWRGTAPLPEAGQQGVAEIYLHDCLAQPLRLPGRVTNVTPDGQVKVRFAPVGESVADLIEKLAFRRHRRQIAGSRQPRRG